MKVTVLAVATSRHKGTPKSVVKEVILREDHGIEGDAHAGAWHRQVSLLASERIEEARQKGFDVSLYPRACIRTSLQALSIKGLSRRCYLKIPHLISFLCPQSTGR